MCLCLCLCLCTCLCLWLCVQQRCSDHLAKNVAKHCGATAAKQLKIAAKAFDVHSFDKAMAKAFNGAVHRAAKEATSPVQPATASGSGSGSNSNPNSDSKQAAPSTANTRKHSRQKRSRARPSGRRAAAATTASASATATSTAAAATTTSVQEGARAAGSSSAASANAGLSRKAVEYLHDVLDICAAWALSHRPPDVALLGRTTTQCGESMHA